MKLHSGWLAAGLLLFAVLACNVTKNPSSSGPISEGHMAKDDNGDPGDKTNTFSPSDHTIHCVVTAKDPKEGMRFKFTWSAVDAGGVKNEKLKDMEITLPGSDKNLVHAHLISPRDWASGKYKCEVEVNDKLEQSIDFWVK